MTEYQLGSDGAIRGDQLTDEIRAITGRDVTILYYPPRTVVVQGGGDADPLIAATIAAHQPQAVYTAQEQVRRNMKQTVQGVVGATVDRLSAPQRDQLLFALLLRAGALDDTGAVRPLDEWL